MILYLLLKAILYILSVIAVIFGSLIPAFPESVTNILNSISTMVAGGLTFVGFFFYPTVIVALVSIFIAWHGFTIVKDAVMKVIGHFIGN